MLSLVLAVGLATGAESIDELRAAYGELSGADHRFLIEADEAATLPDSVAALLSEAALSLPDGDRMEVVSVGPTPTLLLPITALEEVDRQAVADTLAATAWTDPGYVDVGAAIGLVVDELRNEPPTRMQYVYVFGNLCHDPPPESPWAFEGTSGCRQIRGVSRLRDALDLRSRSGLMRAFALTVGRADPDGLRATLRTLNGATQAKDAIVQAQRADLRRFMAQRADRVRDEQLARLVRDEITDAKVRMVGATASGDTAVLRIGSGLKQIGLRIDGLAISSEDAKLLDKRVLLQPEGEVRVQLTLPEPPRALWPHSRPLRFTGTLSGVGTLEPRRVLSGLGISAGWGRVHLEYAIDVEQRYGLPWSATVALAAGAVALLGGVIAWLRRRGLTLP